MGETENKASVERVWYAFDARKFERAADELHEHFIGEWPHSGERIRGRDNFIAVNRDHPDPWTSIEVRRLVAEGDVVVSEVAVYVEGSNPVHAASFFEFDDGKIIRLTEYWVDARSQEPYASRRGLTEPMS